MPDLLEPPKNRFTGLPSYELNLKVPGEAVEFVRRAMSAGTEALQPWYAQASINRAWAAGDQLVDWDRSSRNLIEDPRIDESDKRIIPIFTNYLRQYIVRMIGRVNSSAITWRASARTAQRADIEGATALDRILPHLWERVQMDDPDGLFHAWWEFFNTGAIYANVVWSKHKDEEEEVSAAEVQSMVRAFGRKLEKDDPEAARMDEEALFQAWVRQEVGVPLEQVQLTPGGAIRINRGRLKINWLTGFDVIEDMSTDVWDEKRWFDIRSRQSVASVRERYGEKADHVRGEQKDREEWYTQGWSQRFSRDQVAEDQHNIFESTEVNTLWVPAREEFPTGYFVVVCEGRVLDSGVNPYDHQQVPLIPMYEGLDRYGLRPACTFSDLYVLQRAINKLDAQIISHIDKSVDPDMLAEDHSIDDEEWLKNKPAVFFYKRGTLRPPEPLVRPPLPAHVILEKQMLVEQFKELAGLTDPSVGRPSRDASSGRAILALNERNDQSLIVPTHAMEQGLKTIAEHMVALWAQFVPDRVTFEIAGEHGEKELQSLMGQSLISRQQNPAGAASLLYDIKVEIAEKPSRNEVVDQLDFLLERAVIDPSTSQDAILRAIKDQDVSGLDPTASDRAKADEENAELKIMQDSIAAKELDPEKDPEPVAAIFAGRVRLTTYQNHDVHIRAHSTMLNGIEDKLDPFLVQLMTDHIAQTQQMRVEKMALEVQIQKPPPAGGNGSRSRGGGVPGVSKTESRATGGR